MSAPKAVALRCARCGKEPDPATPARAGGAHYVLRVRSGRTVAAPELCGRWTFAPEAPRFYEPAERPAPPPAADAPAAGFWWDCARDGHVFAGDACMKCGCRAASNPASASELRAREEELRIAKAAGLSILALLAVAALFALQAYQVAQVAQ